VKIISINDAHKELVEAVRKAGGFTKFLKLHGLNDKAHRSGLKKCVDGKVKPFPMYLKYLGIQKVYVKHD
jgi:hypothetical protein